MVNKQKISEAEMMNRMFDEVKGVINGITEDSGLYYIKASSGLLRIGRYKGLYLTGFSYTEPVLEQQAKKLQTMLKERLNIDVRLA